MSTQTSAPSSVSTDTGDTESLMRVLAKIASDEAYIASLGIARASGCSGRAARRRVNEARYVLNTLTY